MSSQSSLDVIPLAGELDITRREEIRRALTLGSSNGPILVDLSEVPYADSTVIAELVNFRNAVHAAGRPLAVLIGSPQFARLVEYAGLSQVLSIFEDRAEALSFLAAQAAS